GRNAVGRSDGHATPAPTIVRSIEVGDARPESPPFARSSTYRPKHPCELARLAPSLDSLVPACTPRCKLRTTGTSPLLGPVSATDEPWPQSPSGSTRRRERPCFAGTK